MKLDWIRHDMVKKDHLGFWTCRTDIREDRRRMNPYLLPGNAEQVFFMEDVLTPEWKIVLRHDPRGRRVIGDSENAFDYTHSVLDNVDRNSAVAVSVADAVDQQSQLRQVPIARVHELDADLRREEDDSHYDDNEYEDEPESDFGVL